MIHDSKKGTTWNSRDVKYLWLANMAEKSGDIDIVNQLNAEIQHRESEAELFKSVFGEVEGLVAQPHDFECLRTLVEYREASCGKFSDYSLQFVRHFVHVCET